MTEKIDKRNVKTTKNIKRVLVELMAEEGFKNVTVRQIVNRAKINRGTFYLHYKDKFDLLEQLEKDLLEALTVVINATPHQEINQNQIHWENLYDWFSEFTQYVFKQGKLFTLLQSEKGDPSFDRKFYKICELIWQKHQLTARLSIPQNYALTALISMTSGLMLEWVNSGFKETPEKFTEILMKLVQGIPNNILINDIINKD